MVDNDIENIRINIVEQPTIYPTSNLIVDDCIPNRINTAILNRPVYGHRKMCVICGEEEMYPEGATIVASLETICVECRRKLWELVRRVD